MRPIALVTLALSLSIACHKEAAKAPVNEQRVLAKIDDHVITVDDVERQLQKQPPYARARYTSPELLKEYLDSLVRFEVMAREAEKRGYDKDPEVLRAIRQQMVSQMVQHEFDSNLKAEDIPEAEARKYYESHPLEFNRDQEVRVSQIVVKDKAKASKALAEAKTMNSADAEGFRQLVAKYSEDEASKPRGGDLLYFDRRTPMQPKPVIDAAFALKDVNDLSALVPTDTGFHILKLTAKRDAVTKPFADVKADIQRRLLQEGRTTRMKDWVEQMRKQEKIEVFAERLKDVNLTAGGPQKSVALPSSVPPAGSQKPLPSAAAIYGAPAKAAAPATKP
jgi:peptidyl-prolyl cis-trans isomerase C